MSIFPSAGAQLGGDSSNQNLNVLGPDSELGDTFDAFGNAVTGSSRGVVDFNKVVPTATTVISRLAASGSSASAALSLLPSIIAASSASSTGSCGGLFRFCGSLFGGGSSGAASGAITNELFYSGEIVGQASVDRTTGENVIRQYYHSGGIVGKGADLKISEVAAVLMGWPERNPRRSCMHPPHATATTYPTAYSTSLCRRAKNLRLAAKPMR